MDKKRIMHRVHNLATVITAIAQATDDGDFVRLDEALKIAENDLAAIRELAVEPPSEKPTERPFH